MEHKSSIVFKIFSVNKYLRGIVVIIISSHLTQHYVNIGRSNGACRILEQKLEVIILYLAFTHLIK